MALNDAVIEPRRTLILPYKELPLPVITDKDLKDIEFSINKVDFLALSFVRNKDDVKTLKDILHDKGGEYIGVIAKIETRKAVENIDQILDEADAILVARGDLGMYFSLEEIPRLQEYLVRKARMKSKPVIVATQLLESMINSPYPTRSEVVDIMVAVQQGVDALLLAGETAVGKYPVEAAKWVRRIVERYEDQVNIPKEEILKDRRDFNTMMILGVVQLAEDIKAKIVIYTNSGVIVEKMSMFRPKTPILVGSNNERLVKQLKMLWSVDTTYVLSKDYDEGLRETLDKFMDQGKVSKGDVVVMVYGFEDSSNEIMIKILRL